MSPILIAVLLLLVGLALVVAEILLPSGGLITVMAVAAFTGCIIFAFQYDAATGWSLLIGLIICVPVMFVVGFKIFPHTAIGRRMILSPVRAKAVSREAEERPEKADDDDPYHLLLNKTGKTETTLRPSGIAEIEGKRYSVVARGEMIEAQTEIEVIAIEGNNIIVDERAT